MIDEAIAGKRWRLTGMLSNAPFGYYLPFLLKRAALGLNLDVPTLSILQGVNAAATAVGGVAFYRTIRLVGGAPFWGVLSTLLLVASYGVWYFANGEVHHVGLALLLIVLYRIISLRSSHDGACSLTLAVLGLLNAVALFFHQEHFLFGCVVATLLLWERPWRRGVRDVLTYGLAGTAGTMLFILVTGWLAVGARSFEAIAGWYFWQIGYLVWEYEPEPLPVIVLRLVKGQLTAFIYGVQVIVDAARDRAVQALGMVKLFEALSLGALGLAAILAVGLWSERHRILGDLKALEVGALVWLLVYPTMLAWYFPAYAEFYLKTVPALVLLLVVGPIARERAGLPSRWRRPLAAALLVLVATVNGFAAILPWYRYGQMREQLRAVASTTFRPGDLAVSIESGLDAVFVGRVDQLRVKELLYREGKARGFDTIRSEIATRLARNHQVFVHNLLPSRWTLQGLNEPVRNPYHDRYEVSDFEALLRELEARYDLVPVLTYWEESKEPLYLFGRGLDILYEVRQRS